MLNEKSVWVGAGGNVGDVQLTFSSALQEIDNSQYCRVKQVSSLYSTKAWGKEDQDDFLNIAFEIVTMLKPEDLLLFCQEIELKYKRQRLIKWGPRTLDLDLLVYEGVENYCSQSLSLPHSFITQRLFVLVPLNEIAPTLIINDKSVAEWCKKLSGDGIEKLDTSQDWWKLY